MAWYDDLMTKDPDIRGGYSAPELPEGQPKSNPMRSRYGLERGGPTKSGKFPLPSRTNKNLPYMGRRHMEKTGRVPAILDRKTGKVYTGGGRNWLHPQILDEMGLVPELAEAIPDNYEYGNTKTFNPNDDRFLGVFRDLDGNILDRDEAAAGIRKAAPNYIIQPDIHHGNPNREMVGSMTLDRFTEDRLETDRELLSESRRGRPVILDDNTAISDDELANMRENVRKELPEARKERARLEAENRKSPSPARTSRIRELTGKIGRLRNMSTKVLGIASGPVSGVRAAGQWIEGGEQGEDDSTRSVRLLQNLFGMELGVPEPVEVIDKETKKTQRLYNKGWM